MQTLMTSTIHIFRKHCRTALVLAAATGLLPVAGGALAQAPMTTVTGSGDLAIGKPHAYANVFLDRDRFTGSLSLNIRPQDVGKVADLFVVALVDGRAYMNDAGTWVPWNRVRADLKPMASRHLGFIETLEFLDDSPLPAGDFLIAAAYRTEGGDLVVLQDSLKFRVDSAGTEALTRFSSPEAMSAYIKQGMRSTGPGVYRAFSVELAAADTAAGVARVSTTNLQETGVDEADSIKTDGGNLFTLANCDYKACLDVYGLDSGQASASQLASYQLDTDISPSGMYLVQDQPGNDRLITVAGQNPFIAWLDVWGWSGNTTELKFFDAEQPDNLLELETLDIDGSLVSSRRVGDTLYVVTRYTPNLPDYRPFPLDDREADDNDTVLRDASLDDLLPRVRTSREDVLELAGAQDCYLPTSAVDENTNPSIITVTGINIANPEQMNSVCFLGGTETLYMTTNALYLATTQWDYDILAADALVYNPNHTTAIHKFALVNGDISYRGSAEVKGHLGWSDDKKSFRMGENGDYLNVVTSIGDTWNGTSKTRLTVLKDTGASDTLEAVSVIDDIGKPGESLYAARFVGDRAYLVTFRLTDPLYVVDLSDQDNPVLAGELEIDGYSDYLHPLAGDLLLGIGKDAVADDNAADFDGARGAWYQGVKLSLFDVSDLANPREIDSRVLGKRGTESAVLWDHHALSFLPATGIEPARLAIPVQLHDKIPAWEGWDGSDPSAWYDYTHTALYSFEVSDLGITQAGRIVSEVGKNGDDFVISLADDTPVLDDETVSEPRDPDVNADEPVDPIPVDLPARLIAPVFTYYSDRSVLLDDAVFYVHDGKVLSSFWGEDVDASE